MSEEKKDALFDADLQGIMGGRYSEVTAPEVNTPAKKPEPVRRDRPAEPQWEPVREPSWMDKLKEVAKSAAIYGGICLWLFYLQQSELMDSDTAYRAMIVCNLLAGLNIGKCMAKEV